MTRQSTWTCLDCGKRYTAGLISSNVNVWSGPAKVRLSARAHSDATGHRVSVVTEHCVVVTPTVFEVAS